MVRKPFPLGRAMVHENEELLIQNQPSPKLGSPRTHLRNNTYFQSINNQNSSSQLKQQQHERQRSVLIRLCRAGGVDDQRIEETRVVHVLDGQVTETREGEEEEAEEEEQTISTYSDGKAGKEYEMTRAQIRDRFFSSSAYQPQQQQRPTTRATPFQDSSYQYLEDTLPQVSAHVAGDARQRRVSRSLSPRKRPTRGFSISDTIIQQQPPKRHSSLSPRHKVRSRSMSKSPRHHPSSSKSRNPLQTITAKTKIGVSSKDFKQSQQVVGLHLRQHDLESGSSDEALEFTKERYKRRKAHPTNRQDISPVSQPSHQQMQNTPPFKTLSPLSPEKKRKVARVKANANEDDASFQESSTSSEYESSGTGVSFTKTEKLRLTRQLKRRAILKRKAAKAAAAKNDPMTSFLDSALANAATDFVSTLVAQLGLAQPFIFPTSPLAKETELNDDYNLLRWEEIDETKKCKSTKFNDLESFYEIWNCQNKKTTTEESDFRPQSSHDDTDVTQNLRKTDLASTPVGASNQNKEASSPSSNQNKKETPTTVVSKKDETITVKGSGPVVIDQKEISAVARAMVKLENISMTSGEGGETSEASTNSTEIFEAAQDNEEHRTNAEATTEEVKTTPNEPKKAVTSGKEGETSEASTIANEIEAVQNNEDLETDAEAKAEDVKTTPYEPKKAAESKDQTMIVDVEASNSTKGRPKNEQLSIEDDEDLSLTYSVEENTKTIYDISKSEIEESSVAKLVSKFEKELPMRSLSPIIGAKQRNQQRNPTNDLAVALSLSADDDSLVPITRKKELNVIKTTVTTMSRAAQAMATQTLKTGPESTFQDEHKRELQEKIKEFRERRENNLQAFLHERSTESKPIVSGASTEGGTSGEPEFLPEILAAPNRVPSGEVSNAPSCSNMSPITNDLHPTIQGRARAFPFHHQESVSAKMNPGDQVDNLSTSIVGHASFTAETLSTSHSAAPKAVDIDEMISRIENMVQRLLVSGKLPSTDPNHDASDSEQKTLRSNTTELLQNLALLKRRRSQISRQEGESNPTIPLTIEYEPRPIQAVEQTANSETLSTPSPIVVPSSLVPPARMSGQTRNLDQRQKTVDQNRNVKPLPNFARIRARRDEAVMHIQQRTQRLAHLGASTGPIPVSSSDCLPRRILDENTQGNVGSLTGRKKSRGPPKPEDLLASCASNAPHQKKASRDDVRLKNYDGQGFVDLTPYKTTNKNTAVPESTSDIDMEEWERLELEKLPLLLSKTKSEEQTDFRTAGIDSSGLGNGRKSHHRPSDDMIYQNPNHATAPKGILVSTTTNTATLRRTMQRDDASIVDVEVDELNSDEVDSDDDTESTGTYGSESDSERLERIASMIQELRLRRRRRR